MAQSNHVSATHKRASSRLATLLGVALGFCLAAVALSAAGADVTVNATAYANNDVTVNTINTGRFAVMIASTTPSLFNARTFVASAYPLYAAADTAITSMNQVIMVGWCAKTTNALNSSISCLNGSKYNDDLSYPYVFIQMRFPKWNNSTLTSPAQVDLSSLSVVSQLDVTTLAGTYDPDKNTSSKDSSYITKITYNTAAVYAVFGVLLGGVVIALIITCVCICRRDNAMASKNRNIIDKAINTLRSDRKKSHRGSDVGTNNNFSDHYNLQDDAVTVGPAPVASSSAASVMPATTAANAANSGFVPPREGSNEYHPTPESRAALEQEMREMKARMAADPAASNLQKPTL